jgi:hypothetical protein
VGSKCFNSAASIPVGFKIQNEIAEAYNMNIPLKNLAALSLVISAIVCSAVLAADNPQNASNVSEMMVKFKAYVTDDIKNQLHLSTGAEIIKRFKAIHLDHVRLVGGASHKQIIKSYRSNQYVEYVQELAVATTPQGRISGR